MKCRVVYVYKAASRKVVLRTSSPGPPVWGCAYSQPDWPVFGAFVPKLADSAV